jgi:hypothetical protein
MDAWGKVILFFCFSTPFLTSQNKRATSIRAAASLLIRAIKELVSPLRGAFCHQTPAPVFVPLMGHFLLSWKEIGPEKWSAGQQEGQMVSILSAQEHRTAASNSFSSPTEGCF